jgi:hypothetical protein
MRVFRYSGKKANNPDGFEDALSGFLLAAIGARTLNTPKIWVV